MISLVGFVKYMIISIHYNDNIGGTINSNCRGKINHKNSCILRLESGISKISPFLHYLLTATLSTLIWALVVSFTNKVTVFFNHFTQEGW